MTAITPTRTTRTTTQQTNNQQPTTNINKQQTTTNRTTTRRTTNNKIDNMYVKLISTLWDYIENMKNTMVLMSRSIHIRNSKTYTWDLLIRRISSSHDSSINITIACWWFTSPFENIVTIFCFLFLMSSHKRMEQNKNNVTKTTYCISDNHC